MIIKFQDTIPPLTDEEFNQLEQNILKDGVREPLTVWGNFLIDGHNRYKIAQKHGMPFETKQIDFADEEEARVWIITNQLGRRNTSIADRAFLILDIQPIIAAEAKKRMTAGSNQYSPVPNVGTGQTSRTRDKLAKIAGISKSSVDYATGIRRDGSEELEQDVKSGKKSLRGAFRQVAPTLKPTSAKQPEAEPVVSIKPVSAATEKTCTTCGRTLPIEKFYFTNGLPVSSCKQCAIARKSYGISPTIREDIEGIQKSYDYMTDTERVNEYSIEDVIGPITAEFERLIRIIDTETRNHADLIENPDNKEALQKALATGVGQIQSKIKDLAR